MQLPTLRDFSLVGGTALSLMYGHSLSVDLDLFSPNTFENDEVIDSLTSEFGHGLEIIRATPKFGIFGFIGEVKIDFVRHPHPLIRPTQEIEAIRK
ncbi:MAG: nucleotidyl transferase AbiEii/AbiGii toxin family protein [Runella sp.]